jgi:hypothetical protein
MVVTEKTGPINDDEWKVAPVEPRHVSESV